MTLACRVLCDRNDNSVPVHMPSHPEHVLLVNDTLSPDWRVNTRSACPIQAFGRSTLAALRTHHDLAVWRLGAESPRGVIDVLGHLRFPHLLQCLFCNSRHHPS